jgi:hypothetical protein
MADFMHQREYLEAGTIVVVTSNTQCNVRVMDDSNFRSFQNRQGCRFLGGGARRFPVRITVPTSGHWNVVIDPRRAAKIAHRWALENRTLVGGHFKTAHLM